MRWVKVNARDDFNYASLAVCERVPAVEAAVDAVNALLHKHRLELVAVDDGTDKLPLLLVEISDLEHKRIPLSDLLSE